MKKIITFVAIILIILAMVTIEQIYLHNSFDQMLEKVETLNTQIENAQNTDVQKITINIQETENYWDSIEDVLCMTINYNDLHRIGEQLQRVKTYAKQNKKEDCLTELNVLIFYVKSYQMIFHINFGNIF